MNKRKLEEEIFQQNKFEKLNNIADSEDDDDDSVDEDNYDVMQEKDIEGKNICFVVPTVNIKKKISNPEICKSSSVLRICH